MFVTAVNAPPPAAAANVTDVSVDSPAGVPTDGEMVWRVGYRVEMRDVMEIHTLGG